MPYIYISMNEPAKCLNWPLDMLNTLRPRQNGRHFTDDILKCIFLNENISILIKISLNFVPKGRINNIPSLVQIMAWCWQVTNHYLNQWWLVYWRIYALLGLNELTLLVLRPKYSMWTWSIQWLLMPCLLSHDIDCMKYGYFCFPWYYIATSRWHCFSVEKWCEKQTFFFMFIQKIISMTRVNLVPGRPSYPASISHCWLEPHQHSLLPLLLPGPPISPSLARLLHSLTGMVVKRVTIMWLASLDIEWKKRKVAIENLDYGLWISGMVTVSQREIIPANNCTMQGQNNWGNWGSPGVMKLWVAWEVLRWLMKFRELCSGGFHPKLVTPPYHGFLNVNTPPNSQNSKRH